MCFGDFLGKGTLCFAYHKEYASYKAACLVMSGLMIELASVKIRKLTFRALALPRSESRNCGLRVVYIQQHGRVVRAPDFKSGGHGFKSPSDH